MQQKWSGLPLSGFMAARQKFLMGKWKWLGLVSQL